MKQNIEENPLVSIVMPVYNSPDLYASIDSVLSQTYPNIEFLIMDDASKSFDKDEIDAYIAKNKEENIKNFEVKVHPENLGTVKTMNELFRKASGEYIFSLAGDDIFSDSQVILDWVAEFIKTKADYITAKRECFSKDFSQSLGIQPERRHQRWIKKKSPKSLFKKMIPANFIFGCCTARSKKSIDCFGLQDETYKLIDDYPFYLYLLRQGVKIHFFDRVVIDYRAGGVSDAERISKEYLDESDYIMEKEVYPFVDKEKAQYRYQRWKDSMNGHSEYEYLRDRWANNRFMSDLIFLRFNIGKLICNPKYSIWIFKKRFFSSRHGKD